MSKLWVQIATIDNRSNKWGFQTKLRFAGSLKMPHRQVTNCGAHCEYGSFIKICEMLEDVFSPPHPWSPVFPDNSWLCTSPVLPCHGNSKDRYISLQGGRGIMHAFLPFFPLELAAVKFHGKENVTQNSVSKSCQMSEIRRQVCEDLTTRHTIFSQTLLVVLRISATNNPL